MDLDFGCISLEGACGFPCPHSFVFFYRSEMRQGNGDKGMKGDGGVALGEDRSRSATTLLRNRNSARLGWLRAALWPTTHGSVKGNGAGRGLFGAAIYGQTSPDAAQTSVRS